MCVRLRFRTQVGLLINSIIIVQDLKVNGAGSQWGCITLLIRKLENLLKDTFKQFPAKCTLLMVKSNLE